MAISHKHDSARKVTYDRARRLFERAVEDKELCPWCFARKKRFYPEEDERTAEELRWGRTKVALRALGHDIREDGTLMVNKATSDADPAMYQEVVPETTIDGTYYPPRPKTVCVCGVVDYTLNESRSLSVLHDCVDHLAEWYGRLELTTYPDEFDEQAAHDITTQLRQYDSLAGQDKVVLTEALRRGLCQ